MPIENLFMILARWGHLLFGITWIGMLYYFNFVQGGYFKAASPEGLKDAKAKLAPSALWWFRWGAMFTFLTGLVLLGYVHGNGQINGYIVAGALMGTFMFLNVWLIIWPNQKIVIGIREGDAATAGPKALLASRTNTLFSAPMLLGMLGSFHGGGEAGSMVTGALINNQAAQMMGMGGFSTGLWIVVVLVIALELNAIFGKIGPMQSVKGVIHCSIGLSAIFLALLQFL